jgi:hypothetical protein
MISMMRTQCGLVIAISLVGLGLAGCGGGEAKGPEKLVPVTGTLKLKGTPVAGATLSFLPYGNTKGTGGFGVTGPDGKFALKHLSGKDGVEPGNYVGIVSLMLKPDGKPVPTGESAMDHGAKESMPAKYTSAESTSIRVTIGDNAAPLDLDLK